MDSSSAKQISNKGAISITILICDNDLAYIGVLREYLKKKYAFLNIYTAHNWTDCLYIAENNTVNLFIIDFELREISGIELYEKLQKFHKEAIYILLTAIEDKSIVIDALNSGIDYFLEKQLDSNIFFSKLNNILSKSFESISNSQLLFDSEENYKIIFENSPIALFELDFSKIKLELDNLGSVQNLDNKNVLKIINDNFSELLDKIIINRINNHTKNLFKIKSIEDLTNNYKNIFTPITFKNFQTTIFRLFKGETYINFISVEKNLIGDDIVGDLYFSVPKGYENNLSKVLLTYVDITARSNQNEEINQLYQTIEGSSAIIILTNLNGDIEYVNKRFCEISGYSFEEVYGKNPRIWKSEYLNNDIYENLWKTIINGNEWKGEFLNKKKNGELYWENAKIIPVKNLKNEIVKFLSVKEDITEKKLSEQKLLQSEARLSLAIESNNLAYFEIALDSSEIKFSDNCIELLGIKNNELMNIDEFYEYLINNVYSDDFLVVKEKFSDVFTKSTKLISIEFRINHNFSGLRWISFNAKIINKRSFFEKDWLIGIVNDITDRKIDLINITNSKDYFEKLVESRTKDLEIEKRKIETIIETISDAIIVFDNNFKISFANNAFKNLEIIVNQINNEKNTANPSFISTIVDYLLDKSNKDIELTIEVVNNQYYLLRTKNINDPVNNIRIGTVVELSNITSFVEYDKLQKEFFSTVSHELRTPITALKLSIQNLEKYGNKLEIAKQEQIWKILISNTRLLAEMIEDLLLLSKVQEHRLELKIEECEINSIIKNEVLPQLEMNRSIKNIKILTKIDQNLKINGDRKRISQIFRIFIDNSIKYSENNKKIVISSIFNYIGPYNPDNKFGFLIKIEDEGMGVKKEELGKLFKRFYRSSEINDKIRGSGLGLAIAKELIEIHGGSVFIESKYKEGTTIFIFFPI
jgi:PAS domain S-box-containing protein